MEDRRAEGHSIRRGRYEDGIDYSLFRIDSDGSYNLIARVNPMVVDSAGKNWWGYPWSVTDIVLDKSKGTRRLLATFDHDIVTDGNISMRRQTYRFRERAYSPGASATGP
jgi:hypothetical protein